MEADGGREKMNRRPDKVYALITIYNPDKDVGRKMAGIAEQVDRIYLCDNSRENNDRLFGQIANCVYIPFKRNLGLSGAFNTILRDQTYGWNAGDFVIFFDQDSEIEEGHVKGMMEEFKLLEKGGFHPGCLGACFFNTSNQRMEMPRMKKFRTGNSYGAPNVITSSLLTQYKKLQAAGFWNDRLFVDYVDWDLCWRMKKHGLTCNITDKVTFIHSVGNGEKKVGLLRIRIGNPQREYYQIRDALYLIGEAYVPLKMRIWLLVSVTIQPVLHYCFLKDRKERLRFIRRGYRDYRHQIHGEIKNVALY